MRNWVSDLLKKQKAILKGHFLLSSGLHSDTYIQCALLFKNPKLTSKVVNLFKGKIKVDVDFVISPAIGGIIFGYELARLFNTEAIFCEREDSELKLRRGFEIKNNQKAIIAEDVITTGGTIREIISILRRYNTEIVGIFSIVNRSNLTVIDKIKIYSLLKLNIKNYTAEDCPLCRKNIKLTKPGSKLIPLSVNR